MPIHDIPARPARRIARRRRWHAHFIILPRRVRCERTGKLHLVWLDWIERRYSESARRWLYRVEG